MKNTFSRLAMFSLLLLFITQYCYTQQANKTSEILTKVITTKDGTFSLQHTRELPKGQTISGTIAIKAFSDKEAKSLKQIKTLREYTLKIGDEVIPTEGIFSVSLPELASTKLAVFSTDGKLVGEFLLELSDAGPARNLQIPKTIRKDVTEKISGKFTGNISDAKIWLDDEAVEIIAGNESDLFFKVEDVDPGQLDLKLEYGEVEAVEIVNLVDYELTVGKLNLIKGESSFLDV